MSTDYPPSALSLDATYRRMTRAELADLVLQMRWGRLSPQDWSVIQYLALRIKRGGNPE